MSYWLLFCSVLFESGWNHTCKMRKMPIHASTVVELLGEPKGLSMLPGDAQCSLLSKK